MRKILFRGKKIDDGEWVYGYYACINSEHRIYTGWNCYTFTNEWYEVIPETVGQYTGITCESGMIFEGDIYTWLDDCGDYHAVKIAIGDFQDYRSKDKIYGPYGETLQGKQFPICNHGFENIIISGNIYDTPELLKNNTLK